LVLHSNLTLEISINKILQHYFNPARCLRGMLGGPGACAPVKFWNVEPLKCHFLRFGVKFCAWSGRGTKRKLMKQDHVWWLF
jgi:hypothetical protein